MSAPSGTGDGLAGRTAVVTGAGSQLSGIGNGRAAAVLLARAGANVVLVAARTGARTLASDFEGDGAGFGEELPGVLAALPAHPADALAAERQP